MKIEALDDFEKQEDWENARMLLYKIWDNDRLCSDKLIRLLSECWYVLSLWDCSMNTAQLSFRMFQNNLIECTNFGIENFGENARFLGITGYMISMLPHLFSVDNSDSSYSEWEQIGIDMLYKSIALNSDDLLVKVLYMGTTGTFSEYTEEKKQSSLSVANYLTNETAIEIYFKNILCAN